MPKTKKAWKLHIEQGVVRHGDYEKLTDEELLRRVRELLRGRWTQGSNALNEEGLPTPPTADDAVAFCLRGACIKVLKPSARVLSSDLHVERSRISLQIAHALGFETSSWLVQWNDTQGRTEDEVLDRIDRCIAVINRKEVKGGRKKLGKNDIAGAVARGRYD